MKIKFLNLILSVSLILFLGFLAKAQNTVGDRNAGGIDANAQPGGTIQEIKRDNSKVVGSRYLFQDWKKGNIELTGGNTLNNQLVRYDVENGIIEIYNSEEDIKVINENFIKSIKVVSNKSIQDDLLLNGKQFYLNYVPLTGLVLSAQIEGKYNLITRFSVKRSDSNYIIALDAGKEESLMSIEKKVYLAIGENITEIPNSKKKTMALFSMDVETAIVKSYIDENDLNLKKYQDLIFLVNYINKEIN